MLLTELGIVGLARRAGKVAIGREAARIAILRHHCRVLLLAQDAPTRVRTRLTAMAESYQVPVVEVVSKAALGERLGCPEVVAAAVCDQSFAEGILNKCLPARDAGASGEPPATDTPEHSRR
ncbi:MAG: ribosomal L7Ae/L30e/S12e/Gadd45 family protein [Calditrichaeota bacterium]|nr:ribosomal L7Ae/L30e/S12e/Gadd45 family protein [Calditrichota bacterium]